MKDGQGRQIDYLRISLTDRCNLRCIYCMPEHGVKSIPHESVLTLEEVHKAIECASQLGIRHIRFTGGEPTVRKGLLGLIERTAQTPGIESVNHQCNTPARYGSRPESCGPFPREYIAGHA